MVTKRDEELMREYNHEEDSGQSGGVYFAENLTVPIRMILLSPDDDFKSASAGQQFYSESSTDDIFDCKKENCLLCCHLKKECETDETISLDRDERRKLTLDLISKFLFMINVDKSELKKLLAMRKFHPGVFNLCMFHEISVKYLSQYRIKFHLRKCIQELFLDVFRLNAQLN